jgi:transcriptional regulator GlxA family with amidase domain
LHPVKRLRGATRGTRTVVIIAFAQCQALDVSGPHEVFASRALPGAGGTGRSPYRILVASPLGGDVETMSGLTFAKTVPLHHLRGILDTVLVVGGTQNAIEYAMRHTNLVAWLRSAAGSVRRLGSVCTGAFLLAEAGLLDGRRATTHWESCARLATRYPKITVEPDAIFVADRPIYTSAGVSASIDLSLALVEEDLGQSAALAIARELVLFLRRPGGQSQFSAGLRAQAGASHRLRDLVSWMVEHPNSDLSVAALARRVRMSERHFARVFKSGTGKTPSRFAAAVRVERAKTFLEESDWPLARVAERSGFGSVDGLQREVRRFLGITPHQYRERFSRAWQPQPSSLT